MRLVRIDHNGTHWYSDDDEPPVTSDDQRAAFEAWAKSPPREWSLLRYSDERTNPLAGEYRNNVDQSAYEAWQAAIEYTYREKQPACTCHERDGSYVCKYCYAQGLRGHMQRDISTQIDGGGCGRND